MTEETPEGVHDPEWFASRSFVHMRQPGPHRRTNDEKEQDVMRVIAHLMGAEGKHIPGSGDHDFELHYPDGRMAWGDEMLWGWTPPGESQKHRELPMLGTTAPVYSPQEWRPDDDLKDMLPDKQVQKHIAKVCGYPVEEKHLAIRAYSPLRSSKPLTSDHPADPVRSELPVQYLTHLWVLADYTEWVLHLTQGMWTMEPMPYLWPELFDHKWGPNAPRGLPTVRGSSWLPPL